MRDFELYHAILGLRAPWTVANVELDVRGQQVVVTVDAGTGLDARTTTLAYDSQSYVQSITDPLGRSPASPTMPSGGRSRRPFPMAG